MSFGVRFGYEVCWQELPNGGHCMKRLRHHGGCAGPPDTGGRMDEEEFSKSLFRMRDYINDLLDDMSTGAVKAKEEKEAILGDIDFLLKDIKEKAK